MKFKLLTALCWSLFLPNVLNADFIASANLRFSTRIFIQDSTTGQLVKTIDAPTFSLTADGLGLAADIENEHFYISTEIELYRIGFDGSGLTYLTPFFGSRGTRGLGFHQQSGALFGTRENKLFRFDPHPVFEDRFVTTEVAVFDDLAWLPGFDIDPDTGRMFAVDDVFDNVVELFLDGTHSVIAPLPDSPSTRTPGLAVGGGEIFVIENGVDEVFTVIDIETGAINRTFDSPYNFDGSYSGGVYFRSNSIPEPSTAAFLILALPAFFKRRRNRCN